METEEAGAGGEGLGPHAKSGTIMELARVYEKAYTEGLSKHEDSINKRISKLDVIIATKTGQQIKEQKKKELQEMMNYKKL